MKVFSAEGGSLGSVAETLQIKNEVGTMMAIAKELLMM